MTTKGWKYAEVSCHWMNPDGFTLEHGENDATDSGYIGWHVLRHSETEKGMSGPIQTYLSYIGQMIVVREAARA